MFNPKIKIIKNKLLLSFRPLVCNNVREYTICSKNEGEWAVRCFTLTTDMRDFIGNITEINKEKHFCCVKGVYRGRILNIKNIKVCSSNIRKIGDRVMVTEHVDINGKFGFIATKKRVIYDNINFIKVGWSNNHKSRLLIADIYTGDYKIEEGKPNFMRYPN